MRELSRRLFRAANEGFLTGSEVEKLILSSYIAEEIINNENATRGLILQKFGTDCLEILDNKPAVLKEFVDAVNRIIKSGVRCYYNHGIQIPIHSVRMMPPYETNSKFMRERLSTMIQVKIQTNIYGEDYVWVNLDMQNVKFGNNI